MEIRYSRITFHLPSLVVTVPSGDAAKPLNLVVKSGNSDIRVSGVTGSVAVEAGGTGAADVSVTPAIRTRDPGIALVGTPQR